MIKLLCYCNEYKDRFCIFHWIYATAYQFIMKLTHKFNWHYAPPIYPDGDTQLWCKWCGFRETIEYRDRSQDHINQDCDQACTEEI